MMKKVTKKSLILFLVIIIALTAAVHVFAETIFTDDNGFSYTQLDGNNASICNWDGGSDTLSIPLTVNDSYVKEISAWAFSGRDDFSTVIFYQADYLSLIGAMAFKGSAISGSVNLPAQVQIIGASAFQECASLETLYYNAVADIPDQCFYKCTSLEKVTIADNVKKIGKLAFAGCESLSYVWIPKSVTDINATAFNNDTDLVIYCYTNSAAHQFAVDNGYEFVLLDAPVPTEPPTEAPTEAPTEIPTAEPTQPVTEAPTQAPVAILGDVDGDGNVSTIDATFMQRYLASVAYPDYCNFAHGDVDGDGTITILDVTYIMRYLASIDVPYPINEPIQNQ